MFNLIHDQRNAQENSNDIPFFGYENGKDQKVNHTLPEEGGERHTLPMGV